MELTAREHYIAHLLLCKIYQSDALAHNKMVYAVLCMRRGIADGRRSYKFNSRLYEKMRLKFVDLARKFMTDHCPTRGKIWIYNLDLLQSKPWPKEQPIPDGWKIGRHYVGTMKKMVRIRDKL